MGHTSAAVGLVAAAATATGLFGLAGPASATTAAPSSGTAPSAAAAKCDAGSWAARIQGVPKSLAAGSRSGDYLYHDRHGMHLRVTHPGGSRTVYTGVIASSSAMRMDRVKLEKGDSAPLSADHKSLTFVFANYGHIDGVDFHTDCAASITMSRLNVGSQPLARDRVYLGATKAHPAHIPFTVHRTAATG